MQRSCVKEFEDYKEVLRPLFDERANAITVEVLKSFSLENSKELVISNMSTREVFAIFFSDQEFKRNNQTYNCFIEFYAKEYMYAYDLQISEITPAPPEVFAFIYSSNYSELLEYPFESSRTVSFNRPIPKASIFLPKSIHCNILEKIYWSTPQQLLISRALTLKGMQQILKLSLYQYSFKD